MGISEKLQETSAYYQRGIIVLYLEGNFWRGYDESCYLFTNAVKIYQIQKRHYKNLGKDVVYMGFPVGSKDKILHGFRINPIDEKRLLVAVNNPIIDVSAFEAWKAPIPSTEQTINKKMSYDNLPIFKTTYDLLRTVYEISQSISKEFKYSLVEIIKKQLSALLVLIFKANLRSNNEEKVEDIKNASYCLVEVKINIRLLLDFKQITPNKYGALAESVESISKQLVIWEEKYLKSIQ